jgi:hypothetical protein
MVAPLVSSRLRGPEKVQSPSSRPDFFSNEPFGDYVDGHGRFLPRLGSHLVASRTVVDRSSANTAGQIRATEFVRTVLMNDEFAR